MPSVSPYPPPFASARPTKVQQPHRVSFGDDPVRKVLIENRIKTPASQSPSRVRRLFGPSMWILGGALITFATAGILHFIGLPLMAIGAYKAYKRW